MDPILYGARKMVYEKLVPVSLKYVDFEQNVVNLSTTEELRFKIVVQGPEDSPEEVLLEVTTDNDLYFYYTHTCNEDKLATISKQQHFCSELREYARSLIKVFNKAQQDSRKFSCAITILSDSKATLSITMTTDFKVILILTIDLTG